MRINPETDEPEILCFDCNLEVLARARGTTKKQALVERENIFGIFYQFKDMKLEEYLLKKKEKEFGSTEEFNKLMKRITDVWNDIPIEKKKSFDNLDKKERAKIFRKIKVK
ncbi:MAG: hypothetical protein J7M11_04455 [Elusimicrobia bacterium]|nr:hypothetical protein [Elusimicrobiota bacterium]